jgi:hypothetical protein
LTTDEGAEKYKNWGLAYKNHKLAKTWIPVGIIATIFIALFTRNLFSHFMLFVFITIGFFIVKSLFKSNSNKRERQYLTGRWNYAGELAKKIISIIGGYYYIFPDAQMFFFNDKLCIYADTSEGGLTAYNKESIKKVNIEHVNMGSTTVSTSNTTGIGFNSGSIDRYSLDYRGRSVDFSTTKTNSNTQTHYEWKLDILTSFMDTPHITMVFPDNKDGEETAKRACALLS